jgi:formylglycine-generating enzyme required for sulfatase activity
VQRRPGQPQRIRGGASAIHEYGNSGAEECCSGLASGRERSVNTSPAASFPPHAFGLYDLHGNVRQFVLECFAKSYAGLPPDGSAYEADIGLKITGDLAEMSGTRSCSYRMLRGEGWGDPPSMIRSAFRNFAPPPGETLDKYRSAGVGFRVARTLD